MAKRTKKVGILGKYGTRYGAAQRKSIKKFEISQRATYGCPFCGKVRAKVKSNPVFPVGHREEISCGRLEVQSLQEDSRWRRLDPLHLSRLDSQGHRHPSEKTQRGGCSGEVCMNDYRHLVILRRPRRSACAQQAPLVDNRSRAFRSVPCRER